MKDKKPKAKPRLKIIGLMDNDKIKWKKINCSCSQDPKDVLHQYPLTPCINCHGQKNEDSLPREPFEVKDFDLDKNGATKTTYTTRLITEITIHRHKDDSILGWTF
jgi:hypothetical protein